MMRAREPLCHIYEAICPISSLLKKFIGQELYPRFRENFFTNYEKLRLEIKTSLFGSEADAHRLDRHKLSALVAFGVLSTSAYVQHMRLPRQCGDDGDANLARYQSLPNEMFAWQACATVLLNYIIADARTKGDGAQADKLKNYIFTPTSQYYYVNGCCVGLFPVSHAGGANTEYIDTILMLLNYYNHYNQFNLLGILSLAQILYFYEAEITRIIVTALESCAHEESRE